MWRGPNPAISRLMTEYVALLDIDGTLVDSTYFHAIGWWRAFRRFDVTVPMAVLHRLVGMGGDQVTKTICGEKRDDIAKAEAEEYEPFMDELEPLPGAVDLIHRITEAGLSPVLASSSPEKHISRLIEVVGAGEKIVAVTNADDADRTKPHPDIFKAALEKANASPECSVAIGDARWDIEAAAKLNIPTIGVLAGGWSEQELRDAGAVEVYQHPAEIVERFDETILARLAAQKRASFVHSW
jgi:HAD superfamily hydrolase (TIGR01509 family)